MNSKNEETAVNIFSQSRLKVTNFDNEHSVDVLGLKIPGLGTGLLVEAQCRD